MSLGSAATLLDTSTPYGALPNTMISNAKARQSPRSHHSGFLELLSELNPLQYIPIVGTIYRAVTGNTIPDMARNVGSLVVSAVTGGPIGVATTAAIMAIERITGFDPDALGRKVLAGLGVGSIAAKPATTAAPAGAPAGADMPEHLEASNASAAPWSPAQLRAYGVMIAKGGSMQRGSDQSSDVLNGLELVRLASYTAGAAYATSSAPASHTALA